MEKITIPAHVIPPGDVKAFIAQVRHSQTNSVSIRYAALWALGARDTLSPESLTFLEELCSKYHSECSLFPNPTGLETRSFALRLKDCPEAAKNVICYPGNQSRHTPSYAELYQLVWIEQRWPDLCQVLSGNRSIAE